ncbi:RDD family protein [uncultured Fluviicola sp.]|uniref:RDD family protein n=1 Tax=uncultured Fluviicola sp. TaxID=463303 RepID=UPI0025ED2153|nr:RDD family protein [uncultured Fluviicola sp.]
MNTIENLKVEKTVFKNQRDENGIVTKVAETKMVGRPPEVVSQGVRFGYFLIDVVFFYIITFIVGMLIGIIVVATGNVEALRPDSTLIGVLNYIGYPIFFLYYAISEGLGGATLGKLICGYTVIDEHANKVSFSKALLRTVCRYIPFESFSCFGERGWHDTLSKTYVVKRSEKAELQKLLGSFSEKQEDLLD